MNEFDNVSNKFMTALQLVDAIFCSFLWRLSGKKEDLS